MNARFAADRLFNNLGLIEHGELTVETPDGKVRNFGGRKNGERAKVVVKDWRVITNLIRKGDVGFAEDYRKGAWETDNLIALTELSLVNRSALDRVIFGNRFSRILFALSYLMRLNTRKGSRANIHSHYDLGNNFYGLWLDRSMTYSSALYRNGGETLEEAQRAKYDRILDVLGNKGGLLEIGCGWGGFAERAVEKGGFDVKGITISEGQFAYAKRRLGQRAEIALEDYRSQKGKFDGLVSIEMFEAVGERYWQTYFGKIKSLLAPGGKAVIQTITMNETDFPRYRKAGDFIRSFIFPGGMLPSPSGFLKAAEKAGLRVGGQLCFGRDYARTLEEWLKNFEQKREAVAAMGFDEGFIRLWRFYLASCVAGFRTGRTNVMQVELGHA